MITVLSRWTLASFLCASLAACGGGQDAPAGTSEQNQTDLTGEQTALADDALEQINAAAEQGSEGPNYVRGLAPDAHSRLVPLPATSEGPRTPDALRADLEAVGVSQRGAARIAGFYRSTVYESSSQFISGSQIYMLEAEDEPVRADGIVFHFIRVFSECSSASLNVFDLEGDRVLKDNATACD